MPKLFFFFFFFIAIGTLISCGGTKSVTKNELRTDSLKKVSTKPTTFTYRFHVTTLGLGANQHHDEISIDTTGQIMYNAQQHFKNGDWKRVPGMAFIEPKDEDTLLTFIRQDALFSIEESDVTPQCPDGETYSFIIYRSDLKKEIRFKTNSCAAEFNLLTGAKRKLFPGFLAYIDRLRDRYRPQLMD
jgi:hypothetical protein